MSELSEQSDQVQVVLPGDERRRSQRVVIRVAVTLHFFDQGKPSSVPAQTMSVNDHGALVLCNHAFPNGARLELEHNRTQERQGCHVARNPAESPDGFYVPLEFDVPAKGFWQISFPPVSQKTTAG